MKSDKLKEIPEGLDVVVVRPDFKGAHIKVKNIKVGEGFYKGKLLLIAED